MTTSAVIRAAARELYRELPDAPPVALCAGPLEWPRPCPDCGAETLRPTPADSIGTDGDC